MALTEVRLRTMLRDRNKNASSGENVTMLRVTAVTAALSALTFLSVDLPAQPFTSASSKNLYIVVMRDTPAAVHAKAVSGRRLNKQDATVASYADSLRTSQDALLARIGGARKVYSYSYALNGFAAELTAAQVARLKTDRNVISVVRNQIRKLDTLTTPRFLGLDAPGGVWEQEGGPNNAGDGVIVGVIDSGIWPEHPSFAARRPNAPLPAVWSGICQAGESFPKTSCNSKVIGARWYSEGFGGDAAIRSIFSYEFISPRAADGHGVHTASTAVGNYHVNANANGVNLGYISGMAPAARLAVYKACWGFSDDPAAGCATVDTVAAIDQAVADGVDVINFSIGGSTSSFVDPVEFAFMLAADAGVFVAAAAGNEGADGPSTVAHNSPWLTTVAMGTHDRRFEATVVLANGVKYQGSSLDDRGLSEKRVVLAANVTLRGQDPALAALCLPTTLDPTLVQGKIVVCDRGNNARVEKSQVVADAGGVGMILVNLDPNTVNADLHAIPTVHLDNVRGAALKRLIANNPNVKASFTPRRIVTGPQVPAPDIPLDSSHGPAIAGHGDVLKPDILAPGLDILAAYSPIRTGLDYEFESGTSMSSAHVAGLGALIKQKHPDWTPAAIRSALITTATARRNDGKPILEQDTTVVADPFGYGAGLVQTTAALDPGLVYDAGLADWLAFICGVGEACFDGIDPIDPSNLNSPSIAIGDFVGQQTIERTVTNVGHAAATYTAQVQAPRGIKVEVKPSTLTVPAGQSRTFRVQFSRTGSALDTYAFGTLTWSDGVHRVRSPIAIRSAPLSAPTEVSGNGQPISYKVAFGYSGPFRASPRGLVPARRFTRTVRDDPTNDINTALVTGVGIQIIQVQIPAGSSHARFSLFDADTDGNDDLDLYVFDSQGFFIGQSFNAGSNEEIDLPEPVPDTYLVVVHGFETDGPGAKFTLSSWAIGSGPAGNMSVTAPKSATLNTPASLTLKFTNLSKGVRYLGSVAYDGATGMPPPTVVRVQR